MVQLWFRIYRSSDGKDEMTKMGEESDGWEEEREEERTIHPRGRDDSHSCKARWPRIARKNNRCGGEGEADVRLENNIRNVAGKKRRPKLFIFPSLLYHRAKLVNSFRVILLAKFCLQDIFIWTVMKNERRMDWKASNYLLILSFLNFSSIHNFEAFGFPAESFLRWKFVNLNRSKNFPIFFISLFSTVRIKMYVSKTPFRLLF